jgi:hypothetical protein
MKSKRFLIISILLVGLLFSCKKENIERTKDEFYLPIINSENFVDSVTNPFMPLIPGTIYTYQEQTDEGNEINVVTVTTETLTITGVKCIVVTDVLKNENGDTLESTIDWYAQDKDGNVWYFGEDTKEYENGEVSSTAGTWKTGVNGAQPGIAMPGNPILGIPYRQEYLFNEAEDFGKIISTSETVTVPYGTFNNCIMTEEWTPLEPDVVEHKYYASGTGNIKTIMIKGGNEVAELTTKTK